MSGADARGGEVRGIGRREFLVLLGAGTLAACFSDRPTETVDDDEPAVEVAMTDQFTFSPETVTIQAGERVRWVNTSTGMSHTATGDASKANDPAHVQLPAGADPWDSGAVAPGGAFTRAFDVPGEYRYFCIPHEGGGMIGTIIVNP